MSRYSERTWVLTSFCVPEKMVEKIVVSPNAVFLKRLIYLKQKSFSSVPERRSGS